MIPSALTDDELLRYYDELFRRHPATAELSSRLRDHTNEEIELLQEEAETLVADIARLTNDRDALAEALEDFLDDTSAVNAAAARKVLDGLK